MLTTQHLTRRFGTQVGFEDINLEIDAGQMLALIGPSGAGKSTLLRCLALLDPADSGAILIDDLNVTFPHPQTELPHPWPLITAVFQQLYLWPHRTIRDNLLLVASNLERFSVAKDLNPLIEKLKLGKFIDRYPGECSVGERQRAALARAMILRPKYLLLDEVTSALDIEHIGTVITQLMELKSAGTGIIAVTHSLNFARHCADKICFMDGGRIIEQGTADILVHPQKERLKRFVSVLDLAA